jgi:hypothetical protein
MNTPFHTAIFYTYEWPRIKLYFFLKYVLCMFSYYLSSLILGDLWIKAKVTFAIKQAMKAQRASRGIRSYTLSWTVVLDAGGWSVSLSSHFTPMNNSVPLVQEDGRAPGQVFTGSENFVPYRDSIPGPSSP